MCRYTQTFTEAYALELTSSRRAVHPPPAAVDDNFSFGERFGLLWAIFKLIN